MIEEFCDTCVDRASHIRLGDGYYECYVCGYKKQIPAGYPKAGSSER